MANLQIIDVALLRVNEFIAPVIHLMQVKDYSLHPHILKSMRKVRTQMLSDRMLICTNQFQQHLISLCAMGLPFYECIGLPKSPLSEILNLINRRFSGCIAQPSCISSIAGRYCLGLAIIVMSKNLMNRVRGCMLNDDDNLYKAREIRLVSQKSLSVIGHNSCPFFS